MSSPRIKQLEHLLTEKLDKNKKIVHIEEIDFLGQGENFGSTLFRVEVTVKDVLSGKEEIIHSVAKTLPREEMFREIFNIQVTVGKEIAFYNDLLPLMKNFLAESGIDDVNMDFFPKLHGGRLNLDGSDKVDEDSVILLENLITSGFKNIDRLEGFDYETSKIIIKDMATFHAIPLAIKLKKPEIFEKHFRKLLADAINPPKFEFADSNSPQQMLLEIVYQNDKCLPIAVKLAGRLREMDSTIHRPVKEPWGTIAHSDLWVNNMMIKHEGGKPVANKFIDFQNYIYGSGLTDLFFFMWTSIKQSVLEESYDELVKYYHDNFVTLLNKLGCDTKPFSSEHFMEEMNEVARSEIMHVVMFLMIVFGKKGGDSDAPVPKLEQFLIDITLPCKEKIWYMVMEWGRRNWL